MPSGSSGSRSGAGRRRKARDDDYARIVDEVIKPRFREICENLVESALQGDVRAVREIMDRVVGKPDQRLEGGFDGNFTLKVVRTDARPRAEDDREIETTDARR